MYVAAMTSDKDIATVERFIAASPEKIFDLLADPARHEEIDGSGTVRQATTGSTRLALGSKFGMSMKAGVGYSMESTVIEFDENTRIAWQTRPPNKVAAVFAGGRIWRYELEPVDGGTNVRETWDITQEQQKWMVRPARQKTIANMEKTLARIDELVTNR
jgi:uncharacterized protein YndB with AHSA1/START domain